jgi:uncharacterized lipoprotein YddW (UPF0748 family)
MRSHHVPKILSAALVLLLVLACWPKSAPAANPEARAVWVTRWEYTSGGLLPTTHKANIRRMMDRAVEGHFNVIVFQVRGQGDAFYNSSLEPWAFELTGNNAYSLGTDPGWDPLQYAIEQAHQRGLELHAWLNTFNAWKGSTPPPTGIDPEHMYNLHPEWICTDWNGTPMPLSSDYVTFSPGNPEVIQHVHDVAMDVLTRYDVDGIHWDYIRYPRDVYSRDFVTDSLFFEQYGKYPDEDVEQWKNWQRDRITFFLRDFYHAATAVKPMLKVSAAVIGRYDHPSSGWDAYNTVYQDAQKWAAWGIVDYLAPMIYWNMDSFAPLIDEWTHYSFGRHIYAGIGAYRMEEFGGWSAIEALIDTARAAGSNGLLFFRSGSFDWSDGYYWRHLGENRFADLATVPPMWWKDPIPPETPSGLSVVPAGEDFDLSWEAPQPASDGDTAAYYGVYRTTGAVVDVNDPGQLIHLTVGPQTQFSDDSAQPGLSYRYAVVAYDDGDNESAPSGDVSTGVVTVEDDRVPTRYALHQNYPNPFNANTAITFDLPDAAAVSLRIYNILGQQVVTLVDGPLSPGRHHVAWNGTSATGHQVSSGIYFYSLRTGDRTETKRMILMR